MIDEKFLLNYLLQKDEAFKEYIENWYSDLNYVPMEITTTETRVIVVVPREFDEGEPFNFEVTILTLLSHLIDKLKNINLV